MKNKDSALQMISMLFSRVTALEAQMRGTPNIGSQLDIHLRSEIGNIKELIDNLGDLIERQ